MARKERMAMDNFDTDMDLQFNFDSIDDMYQPPKAEDRSAVTKVGRGLFRGAIGALTSFGTVKRVILKALPREFGEVDRAFSQGVSVARDLYDKSVKELDPALIGLSKSAKRALPAIGKELPGSLGSKLDSFASKLPTGEIGNRGASAEELKEQALQNQVSAAMGQGQAQTALAQQQLVQTAIGNKLLGLQHSESVKYLNAIRISTQNLDNYNTSVTVNYQRKSLEINLRMLSIQAEALSDTRRIGVETMQRLDGILRNTALPEYAKLKASERYGEAIRNRFIGKSLDSVGNRSREFMAKFGANIKNAMAEKMERLRDAFEAGSMAMDAIGDQAEMMEGMAGIGDSMSMTDMISEQVGSGFMEKFMMKLGQKSRNGPIGNFLRNNKYAQKAHYGAKEFMRYANDIPGAADAFKESTAGDSLPFVRALKDLFPNMSPDVSLSRVGVADLQGAAVYTARTDKTINKVIPELLARQLRELTILRTGNTNVELITFDHFKDEFTSKREMTEKIFSKVINKGTRANIVNNKEAMENYLFDENSGVSREAKDKFFNLLLNDAIHMKNSDPKRYASSDVMHSAGIMGDDAENLAAIFRNKFGYDAQGKITHTTGFSDKRSKFQELYKNSTGQMDHQQMVLQSLINAGYMEELKATGIIDSDGNIDKRQLYDYMTGAEFDATGLDNTPGFEGFGFGRKNRRTAGRVKRSWGTKDLQTGKNSAIADEINSGNYMQTGVGSSGGPDIDRLIEAIKESSIRSIAKEQSETLQRIELIMLEKEFGGSRPGLLDKAAGYSEKVRGWFSNKLAKWSDKFEGTRKFFGSAKDRAKSIWDFGRKWGAKGLSALTDFGKNAYQFGRRKASELGSYAWEQGKRGYNAAYEFGRDTALPNMKKWGTDAGEWVMDQAGKTGGRLSRAGTWMGEKFDALRKGMRGEKLEKDQGMISSLFGKMGTGLGWLAGSGIDAAKSLTQRLLGGGALGRNTKQMVDILTSIYRLLDSRLPGKNGDKDGNGYSEGSWQDQYADQEKEAKEAAAAASKAGPDDKNGGILAALGSLLTGKGKKKDEDKEAEDDGDINIGGAIDLGGDDDAKKKPGSKGKVGSRGKAGIFRRGWDATKQFGRNLLKHPVKTGIGALAAVGKGAWWLTKGAATRVAWPLLKAAMMIVGAKPLLIAAAVAGTAYAVHKGYKALTAHRLDDMSSLRYQQYGFAANDEAHFQQVMDLETKIEKFVKSGDGGQLTIDDSTIETSEIVKDFGLNPENKADVTRFVRWYQERFKPVYLTWLTALKNTGGKKIGSAGSMSAKDKLALIKLVAFPDGPYSFDTAPFKDMKSLPIRGSHIANTVSVLTATLEKASLTDVKKSNITEEQTATAATAVTATKLATGQKPADGSKNANVMKVASAAASAGSTGVVSVASAAAGVGKATTFVPDAGNVVKMVTRALTPIESIRMRVYGLTSSESSKVSAIFRLESLVLSNTMVQGNAVVWKGDLFSLADRVSGLFQFSTINSNHGEVWMRWFLYRFLPTYLAYLTNINQVVGSFDKDGDQGKMTAIQTVNLANAMSAATHEGRPVWSFAESPFRDYTLGTDPESIVPFINVISSKAKGAELKEEANRYMSTNDATKVKETEMNVSSAKPSSSFMDRASSIFRSAGTELGKVFSTIRTTAGMIGSGMANAAAGAGSAIAGAFGFGGNTADISDGTGGKVDQIPLPKPGKGYAAFKEMLDFVAKMVGVNNVLLAIICAIESSFNPSARPIDKSGKPLSSATGLFQFIKSTWQGMLAKYGKKFGLSSMASPNDPRASALMGAQLLKDNIEYLKKSLRRNVTFVEAYMAHFLGAGGAAKALSYPPETVLAPLMPDAARSNRWVFFDKTGRALTLGEILANFSAKFKRQAQVWDIKLNDSDLQTAADKEANAAENSPSSSAGTTPTAAPTADATGAQSAAPTPAGMGASPASAPTTTAPSVGGGSGDSGGGTKDGMVPVANPTPSPVAPKPGDAAATNKVRQDDINANQTVSSSEVTAILKESLATQMRSEAVLREIATLMKNGASVMPNAAVPDSRSSAKQVSGRPMPTEAVSLRRSA